MAPIGTLWGKPHQPQTKIIRSIAALNDLELEQPEYHFFNRAAEYTTKFGYGKIPALECSDGFKLLEGATIARYQVCGLGTKVNLLGSDAKENAIVDQWVHFVEHEIGKWSYNYMCTVYGIYTFNRKFLDEQVERLVRSLSYVEAHLATQPSGYLVTDSITLADLFLAGMIYDCSLTSLGAAERAKYPLVFAHYAKVTGMEKVKQFWEKEKFTEVAITEVKPFPYS